MCVLKTLIIGILLGLASCGGQDDHIERSANEKNKPSVAMEDTSICKADWEDHGELVFPGLLTMQECEAYCESIYEQLSSDGRWGYCQYGAERLWELPFYQE